MKLVIAAVDAVIRVLSNPGAGGTLAAVPSGSAGAVAVVLAFALLPIDLRATDDWPHWRGPDRDSTTIADSGWDGGFWKGDQGPPVLWRAELGAGCGSVLVVDDLIYGLGWSEGSDRLICLDLNEGRVRWLQRYDAPRYGRHATGDQGFYEGPSSTPAHDPTTGWLYTLGTDGELRAWNGRAGGAPQWRLNLYDEFDVPRRPQVTERPNTLRDYGYTTAPLVWQDWLLVEVGCPQLGTVAALDKASGEVLWWSELKDQAGHSGGLVPLKVDGVPCVAVLTLTGIAVIRLDGGSAGRTVGRIEWRSHFGNNIATPTAVGQDLLVTTKWNQRTSRLRASLDRGLEEIWTSDRSSNVCSAVVHDGFVYWAHRGLYCQDWETGELKWSGGRFSDASSIVVTGDGRLILWSNDGDLALVEGAGRSPDAYRELAWAGGVSDNMAWPHVVVVEGRILAKDRGGRLTCLKIGQR